MKIKNDTDEEIVIKSGEEIDVRRYTLWIDERREIDYIGIDRLRGQPFVKEEDKVSNQREQSTDIEEMIEQSAILREKKDGETKIICHYQEDGEKCGKPCKNINGLKIHWGKEHGDKEFYLPEEETQ